MPNLIWYVNNITFLDGYLSLFSIQLNDLVWCHFILGVYIPAFIWFCFTPIYGCLIVLVPVQCVSMSVYAVCTYVCILL